MIEAVLPWVLAVLGLATLLTLARLLRGPTLIDRIVALDAGYVLLALVLLVLERIWPQDLLAEVAVLVAVFGFFSTWLLAKLAAREPHA